MTAGLAAGKLLCGIEVGRIDRSRDAYATYDRRVVHIGSRRRGRQRGRIRPARCGIGRSGAAPPWWSRSTGQRRRAAVDRTARRLRRSLRRRRAGLLTAKRRSPGRAGLFEVAPGRWELIHREALGPAQHDQDGAGGDHAGRAAADESYRFVIGESAVGPQLRLHRVRPSRDGQAPGDSRLVAVGGR